MGVDITESSNRAKAAKSSMDNGVAGRNIMAACSAPTQMSRDAESRNSLATNGNPRCDTQFLLYSELIISVKNKEGWEAGLGR